MAIENHQNPNWNRLTSLSAALLKTYTVDPVTVASRIQAYPFHSGFRAIRVQISGEGMPNIAAIPCSETAAAFLQIAGNPLLLSSLVT